MDLTSILQTDGYHIRNPKYKKGNGEPEFIMTDDPSYAPKTTADLFMEATKRGELGSLGEASAYQKYVRGGITPSHVDDIGNYDIILANNQSTGEKWKNALAQTVVNELAIGTVKTFADLADIVSGQVFRSDNDYSNPVSRYLENLQEEFKANHEIYTDPNKTLGNGALGDAGWWASNVPSIASTITLLIPSKAVVGGTKLIGKLAKEGVSLSRRGSIAMKKLERAAKLTKNTERGQKLRRGLDYGISALTMRTIENYQEGRQVYDDMYQQASETLNGMSQEQYNKFLEQNANEIDNTNVDVNDRDAVARALSHNAATKTFLTDYINIVFDVAQLHALRNPLKYEKNIRRTAAVNKAQRERIAATIKAAGIEAEQGSKKSILRGVGNWFKDRSAAGLIVASELGEGVEEAVNYIAQQEGMHYGRVMLDLEDKNTLGDRLKSYLTNSDLYESAFWGVLGGVAFQSGGSGINRISNRIEKGIRERKENKEGKTTKEKTNVSWQKKYETSEDKYRTEEMAKSVKDLNTLKERLNLIKNNKDPFNTNRELSNEEEREEARDRAIKDYTTSVAFSAIDSGTWDLTKDYLRDENVQKAFKELGVIDDASGDIETLITQIDKVEEDYNNEIRRVSELTTYFTDMPFEYIQIIARDNTKAKQTIDRLDEKIKDYEVAADEHWNLLKDNFDQTIDYKRAVQLTIAAKRIGQLNALKKEINADKNKRESIDGRQQLNQINKELNVIYDSVLGTTPKIKNAEGIETDDTVRQLSELMYIIGNASKIETNNTSGYTINPRSDEYIDFVGKVAAGDLKGILEDRKTELGNYKFEATDEQLIRVFGDFRNGDYKGSYQVLKSTMDKAFDETNGLQNKAKELFDDYSRLAFLNLAKLENIAEMATTTRSVDLAINRTHNWMNQARAAAIKTSLDTIDTLAKKYGYDVMYNKIFSNNNIDNITQEETKNLADALEVLNLTATHNEALADELRQTLLLASVEKAIQDKKSNGETVIEDDGTTGESSSASQNPEIKPIIPQPTNNAGTEAQPIVEDESGQDGQISPLGDTNAIKPQKVVISFDSDGRIDVTNVNSDKGIFGFQYVTQNDGTVLVKASETQKSTSIPKYLLSKTELFEGFDANNTNTAKIDKDPVLAKDENDNWYVKEKGVISYKTENDNSSTASTGEEVKNKYSNLLKQGTAPSTGIPDIDKVHNAAEEEPQNPEVSFAGKAFVDDSEEQAALVKEVKPKVGNIVKSFNNLTTEEEVTAKINQLKEEHKGKFKVEDKTYDGVFKTWTKLALTSLKDKGLLKSSADVLLSSIVDIDGKYDFTAPYKQAVAKMVEDYAKEYDIEKIDGKYYISVEDLLRRIKYIYNDITYANLMYASMVAYMQSKDGKQLYTITDSSIDGILDNVAKTDDERLEERIGSKVDYRVAIDKYFENNSEAFRKAYSSLREGDTLKYEVSDGTILLKKGDTIIGELPYPQKNTTSGNYFNVNMGWIEEVWQEDDGYYTSNVSDFYNFLVKNKTGASQQLWNNIQRLNYDKTLSDTDRRNLIEESAKLIKEYADNLYGSYTKIIESDADDRDIVSHLANIVSYFNAPADDTQKDLHIRKSFNDWFEKLYNTYKEIANFANNIENNDVQIRISNMTSGDVVRNRITNETGSITEEGYYEMTQVNHALSANADACVGIVAPWDVNSFITTERPYGIFVENTMSSRNSGNVYIVIKKNNRDSKGDYEPKNADFVIGTAVNMNDAENDKYEHYHIDKRSVAYKVITKVKEELNYIIDSYSDNPTAENFNKLNDFLDKLFNQNSSNTRLFYGINYASNDSGVALYGNNIDITISKGRGNSNDIRYFGVKKKNVTSTETTNFYYLKHDKDGIKTFKESLNTILSSAKFNIAKEHIQQYRTTGLIQLNEAGNEITITVPNSKTGKPYIKSYKLTAKEKAVGNQTPYNKMIIQGGFIRVNTHVENGSNYRHKGTEGRQAANQTLNVTIDVKSTSPVESNKTVAAKPQQSTKFDIRSVFNNGIANIDDILKNSGYSEEQINLLKELNLLPKNIIFAPKLNETKKKGDDGIEHWEGDNAKSKVDTGLTLIGNKWIDMYNGDGEFIVKSPVEARKAAMRILMHEQLHHRLHADPKKLETYRTKIKDIYDEFEEYLNTNNIQEKDEIRQYLFKKYGDDTDRIYEEFLVEGLTSKRLSSYLNNIKAKENNNLTLFEKLRNFIKEILGLDVNKGSLLEKHIDTIQELFNENENVEEVVKEQPKSKPSKIVVRKPKKDNTGQLELGFDEEIAEETNNKQESKEKSDSSNTNTKELINEILEKTASVRFVTNGGYKGYAERGNLEGTAFKDLTPEEFEQKAKELEQTAVDKLVDLIDNRNISMEDALEFLEDEETFVLMIRTPTIITSLNQNFNARQQIKDTKQEEVEQPKKSRRLIGGAKKINGANTFRSELVDIDSTYTTEMQDIKDKAIADGTFMKAPNGNPTNLNKRQWLQVRTKTFKDWFGDWENDAANASKVVDENGEPLVVYHGSTTKFNEFITEHKNEFTGELDEISAFFSTDKDYAAQYTNPQLRNRGGTPTMYEVFLNVKDPDIRWEHPDPIWGEAALFRGDWRYADNHDGIFGHDLVVTNEMDMDRIIFNKPIKTELTPSKGFEIVVFNPNQIKSATDNVGTFSKTDDNIYHSEIVDDIPNPTKYPTFNSFVKTTDNPALVLRAANNGEINIQCK